MQQIKRGFSAAIISILFINFSLAQNSATPYSAYGIGVMAKKSFVANKGTGHAGIAYRNPYFIPSLNPALLSQQVFSSFEAGVSIRQTTLTDEVTRYDQVDGGLKYASLAFPIIPGKYGVSVSLRPLSSKNYNVFQPQEDNGGIRPLNRRYEGNGTISQFSIANGFQLTDWLAIGAEANFNFGNITESVIIEDIVEGADTINVPFSVSGETFSRYSDFTFSVGTHFQHEIGDNFISYGFTYDFQADLDVSRNESLNLVLESGNEITDDPLDSANFRESGVEGQVRLPAKLAIGIAYGKSNKWALIADAYTRDWTQYRNYGERSANLIVENGVNVGGEFTPDFKSSKYFERVTYRIGFNYQNGPVRIAGTDINSFGITFGTTLPISKASNINIAAELGQRGTLLNDIVRENYLSLNLSFTFNDRWFIRRQFD